MYYFVVKKKEELLNGRTITYLAKNKLFVTREYLTSILNGQRGCSKLLANNICSCSENGTIEYFFKKMNRGE